MNGEPKNSVLKTYLWAALLVFAVVWYGWFRLAEPLRHAPFSSGLHGNDFKHIYLGAWMLTHGENPYDAEALKRARDMRGLKSVNPYVYLPFTGLVLSPLTLLGTHEAMRTWFLLNHAFLLGALVLIVFGLRGRFDWRFFAVALAVAALCGPLHRTLTAGQLNCALLFLYALVFLLERRGWPVAAGGIAAFAFLFKLAPGILLVYFTHAWFARRDNPIAPLKSVVSMCVCSALLMGASVAWVGVERHRDYLPLLGQMGYGKSTWAQDGEAFYRHPNNQSFNSFFHHALVPSRGTKPWIAKDASWANALTRAALLVCVALVLWRTFPRRTLGKRREVVFALFMLLGLLAPSIYWDHYVVIALWPLLACHAILPERSRGVGVFVFLLFTMSMEAFWWKGYEPAFWALRSAVVVFLFMLAWPGARAGALWGLAAAMMTARFPFEAPGLDRGAAILLMSLALWGTLILFGLCLVLADEDVEIRSPSRGLSNQ